jgi:energy-coupling factor transport system ATP-binding protein
LTNRYNQQTDYGTDLIRIQELSFQYAESSHLALNKVDLNIPAGQLLLVMGTAGAGKSTLLQTFNALIPRFLPGEISGWIRIDGLNPGQIGVSAMSGIVGLVFQDFEPQLFSTRVDLEIAFGMENRGIDPQEMYERVRRIVAAVGLQGLENSSPASLSGGQKQRLAIGAVLAATPRILCLDEPTTDLDPVGKAEIFALLRQMKAVTNPLPGLGADTVVVVEHEIEEATFADRIVVLEKGQIVADAPARDILTDVELFQRLGLQPMPLCDYFWRLGVSRDVLPLTLTAAAELFSRENLALDPDCIQTALAKSMAPAARYGGEILRIRGLRYAFDGKEVLKGIDLSIREQEFVAILGANGSGKTTLAKTFNGLLRPQLGEIQLAGHDSRKLSIYELGQIVGYVFQNPDQQIFCDTVFEEVAYGLKLRGVAEPVIRERVGEALTAVGLADCETEDPFSLTKGQRQRVALASVLAIKPRILVLDEPTTGLDYKDQRRMMELIRNLNQAGHTIVMITHTMWVVAEYAHRTVLLRDGMIVADAPTRDIFADETLLAAVAARPPQITQLGNRLGFTALSVAELASCTRKGVRL